MHLRSALPLSVLVALLTSVGACAAPEPPTSTDALVWPVLGGGSGKLAQGVGATTVRIEPTTYASPGVAALSDGSFVVVDGSEQRLVHVTSAGRIRLPGLKAVKGVAPAPNGDIYATFNLDARIYRVDPDTGRQTLVADLRKLKGLDKFEEPANLTTAADGSVWFSIGGSVYRLPAGAKTPTRVAPTSNNFDGLAPLSPSSFAYVNGSTDGVDLYAAGKTTELLKLQAGDEPAIAVLGSDILVGGGVGLQRLTTAGKATVISRDVGDLGPGFGDGGPLSDAVVPAEDVAVGPDGSILATASALVRGVLPATNPLPRLALTTASYGTFATTGVASYVSTFAGPATLTLQDLKGKTVRRASVTLAAGPGTVTLGATPPQGEFILGLQARSPAGAQVYQRLSVATLTSLSIARATAFVKDAEAGSGDGDDEEQVYERAGRCKRVDPKTVDCEVQEVTDDFAEGSGKRTGHKVTCFEIDRIVLAPDRLRYGDGAPGCKTFAKG